MANYFRSFRSNDFFLPLDNSAVFMASTTGSRTPYVFRVSCELTAPIFLPDLETALDKVCERFLFVKTRLRSGIFWYYLDPVSSSPRVTAESVDPCELSGGGRWKKRLVRVRAYGPRVSCEFHHIVTDGTGAMEFLRSLIATYLSLRGASCEDWEDVKKPDSPVDRAEFEDAYESLFRSDIPFPDPLPPAFHLGGKRFRGAEYRATYGSFVLSDVLAVSRSKGVSITEMFVSVYLAVLQDLHESQCSGSYRPICVQVPVNMRKYHPSPTLRNFFLFVPITIDRRLGHYSFEDIVSRVHHSLRLGLDERELDRQIKRNVRGELYLYSRVVPLAVKTVFLRSVGKKAAEAPFSGSLSNMQTIRMPSSFASSIRRFDLLPPRNDTFGASIGVASFGDELTVSIGSRIADASFERNFFSRCSSLGLRATVTSNR
jgi:hypothetical protein